MSDARRGGIVLAMPPAVVVSMLTLFRLLRDHCGPRTAYNLGFAAYWLVWCFAVPLGLLGRRRTRHVLRTGRRPTWPECVALLVPVVGGVATELWPNRAGIDPSVAAVMLASAAVNAVGEELLWRGMFIELVPDDTGRRAIWSLIWFALWHLAPQLVLPSRIGRWRFVLGAAVVGGASTVTGWRGGGLRWTLLPHASTDACGVTAARFRLGRDVDRIADHTTNSDRLPPRGARSSAVRSA